jgi:hypothetical protein
LSFLVLSCPFLNWSLIHAPIATSVLGNGTALPLLLLVALVVRVTMGK